MTATYLDRILASHRATAALDARSLDGLVVEAARCEPVRPFRSALVAEAEISVIAEVKRRSPSQGDLDRDLDPAALARNYAHGGASCLSVLTDEHWFAGSKSDLRAARRATELPTLRKDFTVDPRDVVDARLMGADCVLLIVAALEPSELVDLIALAAEVGLDALVEIHDEHELDRALTAGANLVGVNQRDLVSFAVDRSRAVRMAGEIPEGVVAVAESGISSPADAGPLVAAGYHAILVGESLVRAADPAQAVRELRRAVGDEAGPGRHGS